MSAPAPPTRSACVVIGATPDQLAAIGTSDRIAIRANRLGALVTGRFDGLVVDYALALPGPVYDVMYNAGTGWFVVTVYRGETQPTRWDNRPGQNPGYPRVADILGATTALTILGALDIPAEALGYIEA